MECAPEPQRSQGLISFFAINAAPERAFAQLHDIRAVVDTQSRQIRGHARKLTGITGGFATRACRLRKRDQKAA